MKDRIYSISDEVFALFPGYARGVVLAYDVKNGPSPPELVAMLRDAEASVRARINKEEITQLPNFASWREAYRSFGAKPTKYRASFEAMARRALNNNELPSINTLVDIGNVLSLKNLVPMGGHAIDVVNGNLALRPATGDEEFIPFGSDKMEHPKPGEIVFVEDNTVLTRRWSWRQANHTLTLPETSAIEFNIDGLPPVTAAEIEKICLETEDLIQRFCGGTLNHNILRQENPRLEF